MLKEDCNKLLDWLEDFISSGQVEDELGNNWEEEGLIKYRTDARDDRFLSAYITFKYNQEDEVPETLQNLKLKDYNDDSSSNRIIYFGDRYYNQPGKISRNVSLFDLALMLLNAGFELR